MHLEIYTFILELLVCWNKFLKYGLMIFWIVLVYVGVIKNSILLKYGSTCSCMCPHTHTHTHPHTHTLEIFKKLSAISNAHLPTSPRGTRILKWALISSLLREIKEPTIPKCYHLGFHTQSTGEKGRAGSCWAPRSSGQSFGWVTWRRRSPGVTGCGGFESTE